MGVVRSSPGQLKLVHPGGFVEVHRRPVAAIEIMMKNPRHCVTRPDVFQFPWIVIRPESILEPGNVFFIVPFRTIHRLLREHHLQFPPSGLTPSPKYETPSQNQVQHERLHLASPSSPELSARSTNRSNQYFRSWFSGTGIRDSGGDDGRDSEEDTPLVHQNVPGNSLLPKPCLRHASTKSRGSGTTTGLRNRRVTFADDERYSRRRLTERYYY